jgi:hypothetical protein
VPGCRSSRNLEIHHLVHRADGGSHDAMNLVITCGSCHMAHHRGTVTISGTADHVAVERHAARLSVRAGSQSRKAGAHVDAPADPRLSVVGRKAGECKADDRPPVERRPVERQPVERQPVDRNADTGKLDAAIVRAQTKAALVSLGWTPSIATPRSLPPPSGSVPGCPSSS